MNRPSSTVAVYVLAVFLSGVVVGALGQRLYNASSVSTSGRPAPLNPQEFRRKYIGELQSRLKLDESQVARVNAILDDTRQKFDALRASVREQHKPEFRAIHEAQTAQIEAILTDGQKPEYARLRAEREKRRANRSKQ